MKKLLLGFATAVYLLSYEIEPSTSLCAIVEEGNSDLLYQQEKLLTQINVKNSAGRTALIQACMQGEAIFYCDTIPYTKNEEMALWLLEKGADFNLVDHFGKNALFYAIKTGKYRIAKRLLALKSELDITKRVNDPAKNSLLHKAALYGWSDIGAYLIKRGVSPDLKNRSGEPVLHTAIRAYYKFDQKREIYDFIIMLIRQGADLQITNHFNRNALWLHLQNSTPNSKLTKLLTPTSSY
jgi:ankyrin repeat protein